MTVTAHWYDKAIDSLATKKIDVSSDTLKVMLCTSTYTPSQASHQYKSDVTNEVSGTGYTAAGASLSSVTHAITSHVWALDAADTSWTSSTITARYAVVYDSTPSTDATRPLICYIDFGADVSSSGGTFQITWDSSGIATITAS